MISSALAGVHENILKHTTFRLSVFPFSACLSLLSLLRELLFLHFPATVHIPISLESQLGTPERRPCTPRSAGDFAMNVAGRVRVDAATPCTVASWADARATHQQFFERDNTTDSRASRT